MKIDEIPLLNLTSTIMGKEHRERITLARAHNNIQKD